MRILFETTYVRDEELRLWQRPVGAGAFAYSDGDTAESYIASIVSNASDLSVGSPELARAIRDWPSRYHFDPQRVDVLRPLAHLLRDRTLEIGCGCGAITRYLGELGGKVVSVEGSARRARIAAARCRDLPNVDVIVDNSMQVRLEGQFDAVLFIGVLEYASMFIPGANAHERMLEDAKRLLSPGGVLIVAIENQLGLKYLAGAPEDHLGQAYYGINDLYSVETPTTFGRRQLKGLLERTGFSSVEWLFPFPDYKLPCAVLTEAGLTRHANKASQILSGCPAPNLDQHYYRTFSEPCCWPAVARNGLAPELANSFLAVAHNRAQPTIDANAMAYLFASNRRKAFCKKATVISDPGNSAVEVKRTRTYPTETAPAGSLLHVVQNEPWLDGEPLIYGLQRLLQRQGWTPSDVAHWCAPWLKTLEAASTTVEGRRVVPGQMLDATPFNAIVCTSGELRFFDQEWCFVDPVPLISLALRGLFHSVIRSTPAAAPGEPMTTVLQLCTESLRRAGYDVSDTDSQQFMALEATLQATISLGPSCENQDSTGGLLASWPVECRPANLHQAVSAGERAKTLEIELAATHTHVRNLNALEKERTTREQTLLDELAATHTHVRNLNALEKERTTREQTLLEVERSARQAAEDSRRATEGLLRAREERLVAMQAELDLSAASAADMRSALDDLTEQLRSLVAERDAIVASKAWRMTAPIRKTRNALANPRRALSRVKSMAKRTKAFGPLTPLHQVDTINGEFAFESQGIDPQLALNTVGVIEGWIRIRFSMKAESAELLFPRLYFVRGSEASESAAVDLAVMSDGTVDVICLAPKGTSHLRLDPCSCRGRFSIDNARVDRLNSVQAIAQLGLRRAMRLRRQPHELAHMLKDGLRVLATDGVSVFIEKLQESGRDSSRQRQYEEWIARYDVLSDGDRAAIAGRIAALPYKPLISVVMPVYNIDPQWLTAAIESVRRQLYPHWQLCIADDCSTKPGLRELLSDYEKRDARIKVVYRETNGHISEASNSALALATGEFVALLDHDDELAEQALYLVAEELNTHHDTSILYSDEDKIDAEGHRYDPYFKPDWNPDLLYSQNAVSHLGVYRRSLLESIGGFRKGFEGSQDYDMLLRAVEQTPSTHIRHLPHVLYHWRSISGSTALAGSEKDYAHTAARMALKEHFERRGHTVEVSEAWPGSTLHRIRHALPNPAPVASVIIPTRDRVDLLERCVRTILEHTNYPNFEIIIVDNLSEQPETLKYLDEISCDGRVRIVRYPHPFNYSAINNEAARHAKGSVLALVNNDIEVISGEWLSEMASHAVRPEIGVVGAKLYYPNDTIQHAGVVLGLGGVADHIFRNCHRSTLGDFGQAKLVRNFSAVTAACCVVRKSIFEEVGGLDERLRVAFNDVDFCLRVRERGYRNLWTPYAELYHHESASRGSDESPEKQARFASEIAHMQKRWGEALLLDPAFNPNLALDSTDPTLSFPPRVGKPWNTKMPSATTSDPRSPCKYAQAR